MSTWLPKSQKELQSQTELDDITPLEYEELITPIRFSWPRFVYQALCFLLFLGPFRIIWMFLICIFVSTVLIVHRFLTVIFQLPSKVGRRFCYFISGFGARCLLWSAGIVMIRTKGKPSDISRFIVSNHISFLDSLILGSLRNVRMVFDESFGQNSFFRMLFEWMEPIYTPETSRKKIVKQIIDAADDFSKPPVLVYPETNWESHGTCLFGFNRTAFSTPYTVQPVTLQYRMFAVPQGWNSVAYQGRSFWRYVLSMLCMPPVIVYVTYLPTVTMESDGKSDVAVFASNVELAMANSLGVAAYDHPPHLHVRSRSEFTRKFD